MSGEIKKFEVAYIRGFRRVVSCLLTSLWNFVVFMANSHILELWLYTLLIICEKNFFLSFQFSSTYNPIHIHNLYFALVSHSILSTRKNKEYSQLYELLTTFSHFNVLIMNMCVEQRFIPSSSSSPLPHSHMNVQYSD